MSPSAYSDGTVFTKGKSRYNELNIKVSTIDIVHRLNGAGLIGIKDGWHAGGRGSDTHVADVKIDQLISGRCNGTVSNWER